MILSTAVFAMIGQALYLQPVIDELEKAWPNNRTVNIVFHGHSVPAGYFATPVVDSLNAYPHLVYEGLKKQFPHAVINVIVTAIGGEHSINGEKRFVRDVLPHRPDVLFIDYGLNDRSQPIDEVRKSWTSMVRQAKEKGVKVLLMTPTGDIGADRKNPNDPLAVQARQIREIAAAEEVGLVDSFAAFQALDSIEPYMSQSNHPNRRGHELVANIILKWFKSENR